MPLSTDKMIVDANKIQSDLQTLSKLVISIDKSRKESEIHYDELVKHQPAPKEKLLEAKNLAEREELELRNALEIITSIRNIRNERRIQSRHAGVRALIRRGTWMNMLQTCAQTLPLYISRKTNEKPPPLCGAIPAEPSYTAKMGHMVAAFVLMSDNTENWILAEVISYDQATSKYEVEDILAEQNQKCRYELHKKMVVPLPLMRANPETDPHCLFAKGASVMALYPTTSCFYSGVVNKPPATHTDDYEILFDDENYPNKYSPPLYVNQRYVINKPKIK